MTMTYGIVVPTFGSWADPGAIRAGIQAAEDLGYDVAWFGDHVVIPQYAAHLSPPNWFEPLSCAFIGAGATTRLRFGIDVLVLPIRNPVWLSQLVASADQLAGGRIVLGVGVGYISGEFAATTHVPYKQRGRVTDEFLELLHLLWTHDGPITFNGKWIQIADVLAEPKPNQQPLPVWVGGNGHQAQRRAATLGNGWHPLFMTPDDYRIGRQRILDLRSASDRGSAPFTFSYSCPLTRIVLDDSEFPEPLKPRTNVPAEYNYSPPPPTDDRGRPRFVGRPDEVAADVQAFADAGVEHLALRPSVGAPGSDVDDFIEQARRFMELVAPGLDNSGTAPVPPATDPSRV